jgi:4-amino-4-deoxy-L-arabinose transferase-like glycosyltransferase
MLGWMFVIFFIVAIFFILLSIFVPEEEPYWKITFIVLSAVIFFVLSLSNLTIETPYQRFNSTTGNIEVGYDVYVSESNTYMSYFYMLMGSLSMIYLVILIFQTYYENLDRKRREEDMEFWGEE